MISMDSILFNNCIWFQTTFLAQSCEYVWKDPCLNREVYLYINSINQIPTSCIPPFVMTPRHYWCFYISIFTVLLDPIATRWKIFKEVWCWSNEDPTTFIFDIVVVWIHFSVFFANCYSDFDQFYSTIISWIST